MREGDRHCERIRVIRTYSTAIKTTNGDAETEKHTNQEEDESGGEKSFGKPDDILSGEFNRNRRKKK
jgi:hypothetical protein